MPCVSSLVKSDVAEGATNTPRPLTHSLELSKEGLAMDATQIAEEWRSIPGYQGRYEASSHGRVRSLDRLKSNGSSKLVPLLGRV